MRRETAVLFIIPQAHSLLGLAEMIYSEMFGVKPYVCLSGTSFGEQTDLALILLLVYNFWVVCNTHEFSGNDRWDPVTFHRSLILM